MCYLGECNIFSMMIFVSLEVSVDVNLGLYRQTDLFHWISHFNLMSFQSL